MFFDIMATSLMKVKSKSACNCALKNSSMYDSSQNMKSVDLGNRLFHLHDTRRTLTLLSGPHFPSFHLHRTRPRRTGPHFSSFHLDRIFPRRTINFYRCSLISHCPRSPLVPVPHPSPVPPFIRRSKITFPSAGFVWNHILSPHPTGIQKFILSTTKRRTSKLYSRLLGIHTIETFVFQ